VPGFTPTGTNREIGRMKLILRGRRFGFSLEEIRQWLEMYESGNPQTQMKVWVEYADRQLTDLKKQRNDLDATIQELDRLRNETSKNLT